MNMLENKIRVAISDDFLDALAQLPRNAGKKVQKFIRNFRRDPTSNAHNYETIESAADPNMRSVRVDQFYRAIVLKPEKGNVYVMLWVDNHDEAYDWAMRRRCVVHPDTGSLQVYSVDEAEYVEPSEVEDDEAEPKIFDAWRDRELRGLGVPDELLSVVRKFRTREELERAAAKLPADAYEALYWLAEGDSYEAVHRAVIMSEPTQEVDTTDFESALENIQSQRKFVLVGDDDELEQVLDASIERWRVFLHPMQRKIVELQASGPIRVLGGAGTGKTVVAMHRAAYLAQQVFNGQRDRILFTTFTRNLAADIEENLKKICDPSALERIEVIHLDRWVHHFLKRQGYPHRIEYYSEGHGVLHELWEQALTLRPQELDLPRTFYREEWEDIVQALGCTTLREYLRARRTGRGVAIKRPERKQIWRVFEEYRNLISDRGIRERSDAIRDARQILADEGDILPYRAVLIDEAQDMGGEAFKLIRQMIPEQKENDLFIVGDGHQRIYRRPVVMKHCGINIVGRNRSHRLRINYRTTDEIRKFAVGLLEGWPVDDLDGGQDTSDQYKSLMHGEPPQVINCETLDAEAKAIADFLSDLSQDDLSACCLVVRTQRQIERYEQALNAQDIPTYRVSRDRFDNRREPGLRLATMHRVKGLEFERVVVAGVSEEFLPLRHRLAGTEDEAVRENLEMQERALFYVALTRAKRAALITSHGVASGFLEAGR